jgi:Ca-activated chloride channel family protein
MPSATIFTEQTQGATYAMLMVTPPVQYDETSPRVPRDLTFIIDTSGSMAGPSIEQAKTSLVAALSRLTTQDRFNVIQFNNTVRSLFSSVEPVTAASVRKAVRYAEGLSANGGTEILPALRQALKSPQEMARVQQIVLLTDGQVGNEEELFELLHQRLGTRRLFTVGIGATPNSHLMRKTAEFGRGTFTYIGNVNEVKDKLDHLFRKLERPVLNDLVFDASGWSGLEQYPARVADLYEGEPIVLTLKAESIPSQAILKGLRGGQPWSLPISFTPASSRSGLSVFWARKKIAALMDETSTDGAEDVVRKAVLEVALGHHLVSKYTSLVAVDITPAGPTSKTMGQEQSAHPGQPQKNIPLHMLAQGATSGQLQLLLGLAGLSLAWVVWAYGRRVV